MLIIGWIDTELFNRMAKSFPKKNANNPYTELLAPISGPVSVGSSIWKKIAPKIADKKNIVKNFKRPK